MLISLAVTEWAEEVEPVVVARSSAGGSADRCSEVRFSKIEVLRSEFVFDAEAKTQPPQLARGHL